VSKLIFSGGTSFTNPSTKTATIRVPAIIDNSAAGSTSGTVKVELWYFSTPYTGASQFGYEVAADTNYGTLSGGGAYGSHLDTVTYKAPPSGVYYPALFLEEYTSSGFVTDSYIDYDSTVSVPDPPLAFAGSASFTTNPSANAATITVPEIVDNRAAGSTSGAVKVELWYFSTPFAGGSQAGYDVADVTYNGTFAGGSTYASQTFPVSYNAPPSGVYYTALLLVENTGSGFVTDSYVDFGPKVSAPVPSLSFVGTTTFTTNPSANTATIAVPEIFDNRAAGSTSGTVQVELWYFSTPFTGASQIGYEVADVTNYVGTLTGGETYGAQTATVFYKAPPSGSYYTSLLLVENTASGSFTDSYIDYGSKTSVGSGQSSTTGKNPARILEAGEGGGNDGASDNDGASGSADASANDAADGSASPLNATGPRITGTSGGQATTDLAPIPPFSGVAITDLFQQQTVTVTLSAAANGTLSNFGTGTFNTATRTYTVTGSAAAVSSDLDGLVFTPTAHEVAPGQTVTTTFTVTATDSEGYSATDGATTVIATASVITTGTSPSGTGLVGSLTANQQLEMVYIAYFNRAADGAGFTFWQNQYTLVLGSGQSTSVALAEQADAFTPQLETFALYPFLSTPNLNLQSSASLAGLTTLITNVYSNLFDRAPDVAGLNFWVNQVSSGTVPLGTAILAIANGVQGSDVTEVLNKITVALDFTTRTSAAGLGLTNVAPSFLPAARSVLAGVDPTSPNDASVTAAENGTTAYINSAKTGGTTVLTTGALASSTPSSSSPVVAASTTTTSSADPGVITVTGSGQLIDPGVGSYTLQFLAGAIADTLVLHTGGVDHVFGFDPSTNFLDFSSLLSGANINLNGDLGALGSYATITDQGANAVVNFDPTGHGGGSPVAVLQGLGSVVTGLDSLVAHGAIRIT
jgi:plastocyanin